MYLKKSTIPFRQKILENVVGKNVGDLTKTEGKFRKNTLKNQGFLTRKHLKSSEALKNVKFFSIFFQGLSDQ